jgi:hypothetical protein
LIVKPSTTYDACNHALGSNSRVRGSKKAESTLNRIEENNVQHLVDATKKAMVDENWYAALTMALSMPDMCGRLESPHKKSQERYEIWFTKYALESFELEIGGEMYVFLNPSDCYALRCAYLHQGEFGLEDQRARKVLGLITFRAPTKGDFIHFVSNDKVLNLKVDMFCTVICNGVEAWLKNMQTDSALLARLENLGRISKPGGQGYL